MHFSLEWTTYWWVVKDVKNGAAQSVWKWVTKYTTFFSVRTDAHWFCAICERKILKVVFQDHETDENCEAYLKKIAECIGKLEETIDHKADYKYHK